MPRQLRLALVIAGHDLRRRLRNRSALVTAFIGPLSLAVVFSVLVGGATGGGFDLGVVDLDGSASSAGLVAALTAPEGTGTSQIRFSAEADEATARQRLDDGQLGAVLVIPAGFGTATSGVVGSGAAPSGPAPSGTATSGVVGSGAAPSAVPSGPAPLDLQVLRDPRRAVAGQVAQSVAQTIASGYQRIALSVATAATGGATPDQALIEAAHQAPAALTLGDLAVGGRELSAAAFYGAAMAILFLFFTVGFAARSVLVERQTGTLPRTLATPASPGAVLAGKTLSVGVLGLAGFLTVWLVTSVAFGAPWGDPLSVVLLMVATVFAIAGVATFVASLARSERQADAATSVTAFVLALLGGNFVGPNLPPMLRRASVLTPNGWALRAFTDLNTDSAGLGRIATTLAVLVAMGAVTGVVGLVRVRRVMVR